MAENQQQLIKALTTSTLHAAEQAHNEAELRQPFVAALQEFVKQSGWQTPLSARQEKTLVSGFADSVFGHVIVEYKSPTLSMDSTKSAAFRKAEEELQRYISEEAGDEPEARTRYIGVGLNGHHIFFLRWRQAPRDDWQVEGPYPLTEQSMAQFTHYLQALSRKSLAPQPLADDFGPKSVAARSMVNALLEAFTGSDHPKVQMLYEEWDRIFGIVYGQDLSKAVKDVQQLADNYEVAAEADLKPLLFCVHTYFALFIKLLTAELMRHHHRMPSFIADLPASSPEDLLRRLRELEEGGIFAQLGITNFLEGDFFGWFLESYTDGLDRALRTMLRTMHGYEPATPQFLPEQTRDLLKGLYQYLVPKKLRHDLGEYYTPDWLAELVLNEVGYEGDPSQRLLDPACGSGTFLVLTIRRIRQYADDHLLERKQLVRDILGNVVGFDLNPLAVIAARANYLLALGDLIAEVGTVRIPVYLCDSILTPAEAAEQGQLLEEGPKVPSVVGTFHLPRAVVDEGRLDALAGCLETCVGEEHSPEEFLDRVERDCDLSEEGFTQSRSMLRDLYGRLTDLEAEGRNRIWARLIKNAFAPLFQPKFDYVVGNPPWVNWEHLSADYRKATGQVWDHYGLFTQEGYAALVPAGKLDLAMLFTYVCADEYLKPQGQLGFVITQTVFKSKGGDGFRQFMLPGEVPMGVGRVNDLVDLKPFEGATNRTATISLTKGESTSYPVPYAIWECTGRARPDMSDSLGLVRENTRRIELGATPIKGRQGAPWLTTAPQALLAVHKITGESSYRARAGIYTRGANAVYWVEILREVGEDQILLRNRTESGRKEFVSIERSVEKDLLYPLLRGRDIARWRTEPETYVIVPHTIEHSKSGIPEGELKRHYPRAYSFFKEFEEDLSNRSMMKKIGKGKPFYALFEIGPYTFAPWKVVWKGLASGSVAAVAGSVEDPLLGTRTVIPEHNTMLVAFETSHEAHYFCALFNSSPASLVIKSYIAWFYSTHVLDNVAIPKFDPGDETHQRLARLSEQAHQLAAEGSEEELAQVEEEIDQAAAKLWGLSEGELAAIKRTLGDLS